MYMGRVLGLGSAVEGLHGEDSLIRVMEGGVVEGWDLQGNRFSWMWEERYRIWPKEGLGLW